MKKKIFKFFGKRSYLSLFDWSLLIIVLIHYKVENTHHIFHHSPRWRFVQNWTIYNLLSVFMFVKLELVNFWLFFFCFINSYFRIGSRFAHSDLQKCIQGLFYVQDIRAKYIIPWIMSNVLRIMQVKGCWLDLNSSRSCPYNELAEAVSVSVLPSASTQ